MVRRIETLPLSLLLALCFVAPRVARAQADTDAEAPPTDTIADASEATEPPPPAAEEDERASADEPAPIETATETEAGTETETEAGTGTETETESDAETEPSRNPIGGPYLVAVGIGFYHWYGGTFGAPPGTYTPGLSVNVVPLDWLELSLAYSISAIEVDLPDASRGHVGFATLSVLLRQELRLFGERIMIGGGIVVGLVHSPQGVREAFGGALAARYLIAVADGFALGPFLDVRAILYELAESNLPIYDLVDGELRAGHSDAHVQIGIAMAF